jgi:predicted cupin superfamily sugar epimerase
MSDADRLISQLELIPHPEGGHFRETFRDQAGQNGRAYSTAIYFLLKRDEVSQWHRIDAVELWHWYAGGPLELTLATSFDADHKTSILGPAISSGQRPQLIVQGGVWQTARSLGDYTLVGCTVAPGFEFAELELGPSAR